MERAADPAAAPPRHDWRCADDLADLASVPRPGPHRPWPLLAAAAIYFLITGLRMHHTYAADLRLPARRRTPATTCSARSSRATTPSSTSLELLVLAAPALIGIFWGAPLIGRELETGTHQFAWNQTVTRTRWLAVKLAVVGLAAIATAGSPQPAC